MTDRERLLVAALSRGGDELPNPVTSLELMAMLEELGADQRRTLGNPHVSYKKPPRRARAAGSWR